MPRKKSTPAPRTTAKIEFGVYHVESDAPWGGYINIRLTDEQKNEFYDWYHENVAQAGIYLDEVLGAGAKVTFSYDRENQCYICSITGALVSGSTERYVVTTRAGRFDEVLALAMWKHVVLARGNYGDFKPRNSQLNNWG